MSAPDYRARIDRFNAELNAFIDLTTEPQGAGLCWGIKSNIAVEGLPLTAGCEAYRETRANSDAVVVSRIREAGHTILGTVNMHEGALGATTDNEAYGRTCNPWSLDRTPGGSSGGSGAAVAAGLCDVALGTDTMGSVRIPAAYCGVQGHKPSYGLVPDTGVVPLSPTLDHVGPLARRVDTLWRAMQVMAEWEVGSALSPATLSGLKFGCWSGLGHIDQSEPVRLGYENVVAALSESGAKGTSFAPPVYDYSKSRRAGLLVSELEGAEEHGVQVDGPRPEGFSEAFLSLLQWGVRQPKEKCDTAYAHLADVKRAAEQVWQTVDFVIAPTAPQQAFRFDEPVPSNQADFTAWANFAGLPATAIFCGLADNGLPLSVQIIGPRGHDRETLRVAAALEQIFGPPPMPDPYFDAEVFRTSAQTE